MQVFLHIRQVRSRCFHGCKCRENATIGAIGMDFFAQKIDTHIEKACFFEKDMLKYGLLPDMLSVTKK